MKPTHARIQAVMHNRAPGRTIGTEEAHARNVEAIGRKIARLLAEQTRLRKRGKEVSTELRATRRELRAVLQRDSRMTEDQALLAGQPDAIDASEAARERK